MMENVASIQCCQLSAPISNVEEYELVGVLSWSGRMEFLISFLGLELVTQTCMAFT